ncbi:protein scarlet [Dendroctonus ponderosae]|uniref:ABC transporter domain-containing protein n=2 Tax=Dendroctonus ponderosae TaxID=77166 RepID=A0AAR5NXY6_DENPD|nr:protein scarlet [Dendroctonus ponderosae]
MAHFIFTWENLRYSVTERQSSIWKQTKRKKVIIDGVSGSAISGCVIAIMGVSGSGKTSLLTLLSGQRKGKGVLKINGRAISGKMLRSNSAFVQQKDIFIETLTVYEHITFMAAMSLNQAHSARVLVVHKLLKDFNIENLMYTKIQYLSSGEKRKLSLASNLLSDPCILFCDEPTTGLDSFSAISVVRILETVAVSGKIVFLTVHQPSSQLFESFDNIILLSTNGKVVFQGSPENARAFFENQFLYCPTAYNPAEFYIKNIAVKSSSDEGRIDHMVEVFKEEYAVKFNFSDIEYDGLLLKQRDTEKSFVFALGWLTWRILIDMKRNFKQYSVTFLLIIITAFIIGLTYSSISLNEGSSVQSIQGALLLIVSELIFNGMYQVIFMFPSEVELFIQEKNMYSALPYFVSKIVSLIPFAFVHSLGFLAAYFICLHFLAGVHLFTYMYLILVGASLGGSALGLCLSALFPSIEAVHLFIVPLELLCLLLSGLWIKVNSLSKFFSVVKYLSPFYISYESICIIYWIKLDGVDLCTNVRDIACFHNGTEVLRNYGFTPSYDKVYSNLIYLMILICVYCYIGYIGILRKRALYHV